MTSKDENKTNPSKYKMDYLKRGIALVINLNKYDPNPFNLEEREWSINDVENLTKTLEYLEFDIDLAENLTKSEIEERLEQIASINHENFDCFLCVVMSYGNKDNIVTSDSKFMSFEEIMEPIKSCLTLLDKPKMFLFSMIDDQKIIYSSSNLQSKINKNNETKFNKESDLLIYYSILPNQLSLNNAADGTIFIKSFCNVFNDAYKELPNNMQLLKMFRIINESVSKTGQQQISEPLFRMTKDVYFLPKNVNQNVLIFTFIAFYFFVLLSLGNTDFFRKS